MTIFTLLRALYGLEAGRSCRRCAEPITRADPFGMSESVCVPCRGATAA